MLTYLFFLLISINCTQEDETMDKSSISIVSNGSNDDLSNDTISDCHNSPCAPDKIINDCIIDSSNSSISTKAFEILKHSLERIWCSKIQQNELYPEYDKYVSTVSRPIDDDHGFEVQQIEIESFCNQEQILMCLDECCNAFKLVQADWKLLIIFLGHRYKCFNFIGRGARGKVFQAKNKKTGENVAIKIVYNDEIQDILNNNELLIYLNIRHKNIVKFYEVYQYMNIIILVMEYIPFTLYNFPFSLLDNKKIIFQLIDAIEFLHSRGIQHDDLILENILIDIDNGIKIADFGGSIINSRTKRLFSIGLPHSIVEKSNKIIYHPESDIVEVIDIALIIKQLYVKQYNQKMVLNPSLKPIEHNQFLFCDDELPELKYHVKNIESKTLAMIIFDCIRFNESRKCTLFELRVRMTSFFESGEI